MSIRSSTCSLSGHEAGEARQDQAKPELPGDLLPSLRPTQSRPMPKSNDIITDAVSNAKHPFRQVDDRPGKPKKHRYERRKVKEYIKLGDWSEQTA